MRQTGIITVLLHLVNDKSGIHSDLQKALDVELGFRYLTVVKTSSQKLRLAQVRLL